MLASADDEVVRTVNAQGVSPFVLVCDHASNFLPERFGDLGLDQAQRESHIAWDPGALALSLALSARLDAPVVHSTISRLVIDTNRRLNAPNLFWTLSEATHIPANVGLSVEEREQRISRYYSPFHTAIDELLDARSREARESVLICVHTFTPVYLGVARPWQVGVIHGRDTGFSQALFDALVDQKPPLAAGWNEPYSARDGVTETLERHGDARGFAGSMIEVRNNELADDAGVAFWSDVLADSLQIALERTTAEMRLEH